MKNIFYCSNANKELFAHNTRSSFDSYIDIHDLNYLDDNNLEAAIKSITFDNKTMIQIQKNHAKPNIVIKQIVNNDIYHLLKQFLEDSYDGAEHEEIFSTPDLSKSMDYVVINDGFKNLSIYMEPNKSKFCNLQILTPTCIMHNIYLHDVDIFSESELIHYLNKVLKSVSKSAARPKIMKDLIQKGKDGSTYLKPIEHDIYIEGELGNILNLENIPIKVHSGNSLRDVFRWVKQKNVTSTLENIPIKVYSGNSLSDVFRTSTFPDNYINTVLDYKQEICYYKIGKTIKKLKLNLFKNKKLYGIRSNISNPTIRNSEYDGVISLFAVNKTNDVVHVDFKNPSFFKTRKELLSRGRFEIIAADTNSPPNFTFGSPTYIQVVVRKSEMKQSFNVFLDSSCKKSKVLYPENNATEFTIELPERLSFNRHWQVTLKSLFLPNKIYNIQKCWFTFSIFKMVDGKMKNMSNQKVYLKEGNYPTLKSIIKEILSQITKYKLPFIIEEYNGKVKIKLPLLRAWETPQKGVVHLQDGETAQLNLNATLAYILGYTSSPVEEHSLPFITEFVHTASHEPDMYLIYPKNLIIGCDVVDNTIFGGEHVKLLRLVTNNIHLSSNILSFDFLQNEYVDLNVKEFRSIKIAIMDATGKPVKTDTSIPTRLQLTFSSL